MLFISRDPEERVYSTKYIYITVYVPSSEFGPPYPLSRKRVCPPSPAGEGVGGRTTGEKA